MDILNIFQRNVKILMDHPYPGVTSLDPDDLHVPGADSDQVFEKLYKNAFLLKPNLIIALSDSAYFADLLAKKLGIPFIELQIDTTQATLTLPKDLQNILKDARKKSQGTAPTALIYEDIISTGSGAVRMCALAKSIGTQVKDVLCLIECPRGGRDTLFDLQISLSSLAGWRQQTGFVASPQPMGIPGIYTQTEPFKKREHHRTCRPQFFLPIPNERRYRLDS